eukprot:scaffold50242_cov64-Phaeocystis_antarctica.AAC.4
MLQLALTAVLTEASLNRLARVRHDGVCEGVRGLAGERREGPFRTCSASGSSCTSPISWFEASCFRGEPLSTAESARCCTARLMLCSAPAANFCTIGCSSLTSCSSTGCAPSRRARTASSRSWHMFWRQAAAYSVNDSLPERRSGRSTSTTSVSRRSTFVRLDFGSKASLQRIVNSQGLHNLGQPRERSNFLSDLACVRSECSVHTGHQVRGGLHTIRVRAERREHGLDGVTCRAEHHWALLVLARPNRRVRSPVEFAARQGRGGCELRNRNAIFSINPCVINSRVSCIHLVNTPVYCGCTYAPPRTDRAPTNTSQSNTAVAPCSNARAKHVG